MFSHVFDGETRQAARFCRAGRAFLKMGLSERAFRQVWGKKMQQNARFDGPAFKKAWPARQKRAVCRVSPDAGVLAPGSNSDLKGNFGKFFFEKVEFFNH